MVTASGRIFNLEIKISNLSKSGAVKQMSVLRKMLLLFILWYLSSWTLTICAINNDSKVTRKILRKTTYKGTPSGIRKLHLEHTLALVKLQLSLKLTEPLIFVADLNTVSGILFSFYREQQVHSRWLDAFTGQLIFVQYY